MLNGVVLSCALFIVKLNVIVLSVVMLIAVMLNVIMVSVVTTLKMLYSGFTKH
jgi:hypothetical protein